MALAPEWMSFTKETDPSQDRSILGRERERGDRPAKYGRQHSYHHLNHLPPSSQNSYAIGPYPDRRAPTAPFSCSVAASPSPSFPSPSFHGLSLANEINPRILNRSKSSPGFGSGSKSIKPKLKSPDRNAFDRNFPQSSLGKQHKPKPPKPPLFPPSYGKSHSQPNLLNSEKSNWHQPPPAPFSSSHRPSSPHTPPMHPSAPTPHPATHSLSPPTTPPHHGQPSVVVPSPSPPLPPSTSPPPPTDELDKLRQLVPTAVMPPKSVRPRALVGPPPPLAKRPSTSSLASPSPSMAGSPAMHSNLASYFRKATSEPTLLVHAGAEGPLANPKKAKAEAEKAVVQNRVSFFQHVIRQGTEEDDSPIGPRPPTPPSVEPDTPPTSTPSTPPGVRSPLPDDVEDEEQFLRELGWVPESEDPVPVLTEEEMAEVRVKILLSKTHFTPHTPNAKTEEVRGSRRIGVGVE